jgi:LmbE family N-acetylglucosaminyl deacetylase
MKKVIIISPHPDDETIGCGGTLLKHISNGDQVSWIIVTDMKEIPGVNKKTLDKRNEEIVEVSKKYGFHKIFQLGFPATLLDTLPKRDLISSLANAINEIKPEILYLPNENDIHTDHEQVFIASSAFTKSFRFPYIKDIYVYHTLYETELNLNPNQTSFKPNYFVDISEYLDEKLDIMKIYESELGKHPFPRSIEAIKSHATLMGSISNTNYAEGFVIIKQIR